MILTSGGNSDGLTIKADDDHPYVGITKEEWSAANCQFMNCLLKSGTLNRDDVEFYLLYMTWRINASG